MFQENKFKVGGRGGGGQGRTEERHRGTGHSVPAGGGGGFVLGMRAARQGQELLGCRRLTTH